MFKVSRKSFLGLMLVFIGYCTPILSVNDKSLAIPKDSNLSIGIDQMEQTISDKINPYIGHGKTFTVGAVAGGAATVTAVLLSAKKNKGTGMVKPAMKRFGFGVVEGFGKAIGIGSAGIIGYNHLGGKKVVKSIYQDLTGYAKEDAKELEKKIKTARNKEYIHAAETIRGSLCFPLSLLIKVPKNLDQDEDRD